jgi:hypothetical protein
MQLAPLIFPTISNLGETSGTTTFGSDEFYGTIFSLSNRTSHECPNTFAGQLIA